MKKKRPPTPNTAHKNRSIAKKRGEWELEKGPETNEKKKKNPKGFDAKSKRPYQLSGKAGEKFVAKRGRGKDPKDVSLDGEGH